MITLARMYCCDNYKYWLVKYQNERARNDPYTYTEEDYGLFPRYLVLIDILKRIDLLVGRKFKTFNNCVQEILNAVDYQENILSASNEQEGIIKTTKMYEIQKFRNYILSFNENDLMNEKVKRLRYQKKLGKHESEKIRKTLLEKWDYNGYWYPIDRQHCENSLFLMTKYIEPYEEKIISIINNISSKRFYAIDECGDDYKHSIANFSFPLYDINEKMCCDNTFDWVVYGSHESTISFGGDKLITAIKELLKDYESKFDLWD